jgi:hypothetical protein
LQHCKYNTKAFTLTIYNAVQMCTARPNEQVTSRAHEQHGRNKLSVSYARGTYGRNGQLVHTSHKEGIGVSHTRGIWEEYEFGAHEAYVRNRQFVNTRPM